MKRYVTPQRSCRSCIRFSTCACTETSSALTGSSATISFGRVMSARAMAMRWRCPPLNSCGYLARVGGAQAGRVERLGRARSRCSARPAPCSTASGSATVWPTVRRGSSEPYGSWKTICSRVRARRSSAGDSACRSVPSSSTRPAVGGLERHDDAGERASCPTPTRRRRRGCGRAATAKRDAVERLHFGDGAEQPLARQPVALDPRGLPRPSQASGRLIGPPWRCAPSRRRGASAFGAAGRR